MKLTRLLPLALLATTAFADAPDDLLAQRDAEILKCAASGPGSAPAAAHDKYMLAIGKPQRFGTQAGQDGKPLMPVAGDMPEALRTDFLVAPLLRARDLGVDAATRSALPAMTSRLQARADASVTPNERLAKLAGKNGRSLDPVVRVEVRDLVRSDALRHPQDFMNAATVLSRSKIEDDLLLASELAAAAACRNVPGAIALHASTWDRWSVAAKVAPRYGTTGQAASASVSADFLQASARAASAPSSGTTGSATLRANAP